MYEALISRLEGISKKLDAAGVDVICVAAMTELEAQHKQRIFAEGKDSTNAPIGKYSTKSAYYTKDSFIRTGAFKAQGKENKGAFKNGKERKSMFLQGGYSEFRDIQGRQNNTVNLKFSGSLERSFRVVKFGDDTLYGTTDAHESEKFEGLTEKYGSVFPLTDEEKLFLKSEIVHQTIVATKK